MIDRMLDERRLDGFDLQFIAIVAAILGLGVASIYSVTYTQTGGLAFYIKQLMWIGLGAIAFVVMWVVDYHKIARLSYLLYGIVLVLLFVVLLIDRKSVV